MANSAQVAPGLPIAVDTLVFTVERGLELMLVRRAQAPFEGCWALPGGFIGTSETAEQAARRCLSQKAALEGIYLEQLYTFTRVDRDPRERVISVAYLGMAPNRTLESLESLTQAGQASLFEVTLEGETLRLTDGNGTDLLPEEIAFDHSDMIRLAVTRMRGKLEYTGIGFEFLEDAGAFTLAQLQSVYEAIAGRRYDTPNFRRFIKTRYETTGQIVNTGRRRAGTGKTAALYAWKGIGEGADRA